VAAADAAGRLVEIEIRIQIGLGARMQDSNGRRSDETVTSPDKTAIQPYSRATGTAIDQDPDPDPHPREDDRREETTESEIGGRT